jgi:hypothetical protein
LAAKVGVHSPLALDYHEEPYALEVSLQGSSRVSFLVERNFGDHSCEPECGIAKKSTAISRRKAYCRPFTARESLAYELQEDAEQANAENAVLVAGRKDFEGRDRVAAILCFDNLS